MRHIINWTNVRSGCVHIEMGNIVDMYRVGCILDLAAKTRFSCFVTDQLAWEGNASFNKVGQRTVHPWGERVEINNKTAVI